MLRGRWGLLEEAELPVSAFLFLLGHTHNLLRCVLHAVFAQQVQPRPGRNVTWPSPPTRGNPATQPASITKPEVQSPQ